MACAGHRPAASKPLESLFLWHDVANVDQQQQPGHDVVTLQERKMARLLYRRFRIMKRGLGSAVERPAPGSIAGANLVYLCSVGCISQSDAAVRQTDCHDPDI